MTSPRTSLLASAVLHAGVLAGLGMWGGGAFATVRGEVAIQVQPPDAPGATWLPLAAGPAEVTIEPATAEPMETAAEPMEEPDLRAYEPPPRRSEARPVPTSAPAAWFTRWRPKEPPAEPPVSTPPVEAAVVEVIPGANPPPAYPWAARRRGQEGVVTVDVGVDADGAVLWARIGRSSGHASLDAAALAAVQEWRFRHGPGSTRVEVEFVLRTR